MICLASSDLVLLTFLTFFDFHRCLILFSLAWALTTTKLLGVGRDASDKDIKKAYKKMVWIYSSLAHQPDLTTVTGSEMAP